MHAHLAAAGICDLKKSPLFHGVGELWRPTANSITRNHVLPMVKGRATNLYERTWGDIAPDEAVRIAICSSTTLGWGRICPV